MGLINLRGKKVEIEFASLEEVMPPKSRIEEYHYLLWSPKYRMIYQLDMVFVDGVLRKLRITELGSRTPFVRYEFKKYLRKEWKEEWLYDEAYFFWRKRSLDDLFDTVSRLLAHSYVIEGEERERMGWWEEYKFPQDIAQELGQIL